MAGINLDMNLSETFGQIDRVQGSFKSFKAEVMQAGDEAAKETAEEFRDHLKDVIKASRIDRETGELLESWRVVPKANGNYRVMSVADHAIYLEVGTTAHQIEAVNADQLVFEPEPGTVGNYPPENVVRYAPQPLIAIDSVDHPGNDAYRYFEGAVRSKDWDTILEDKVREKLRPIIAKHSTR